MRTILVIIFITMATQASAWSENITRTEVNFNTDKIVLENGLSFHIPKVLEIKDDLC